MEKKKPAGVVVIAVLQLVFGGLGLLGALVTLSGATDQLMAFNQKSLPPGQQQFSMPQLEKRIEQRFPQYSTIKNVLTGVNALLCVMMVGSGIGLLMMQSWGRLLTIAYAVLSILVTIASLIFQVAVVMPFMSEVIKELTNQPGMKPQEAQIVAMGAQIGMVIGVGVAALLVIYPIIVLVVMLMPSVRAAFSGETLGTEPEGYDDRYPPRDYTDPEDRFRPSGR